MWNRCSSALLIAICATGLFTSRVRADERPVSFNRDIRPILSDKCFACHGPDQGQRATDLRLDKPKIAHSQLESGVTAIVPGQPDQSELVRRITSDDIFTQMPPVDSNKHLTDEQIALLRRWVAEGGEYEKHWSFVAPKRPPMPETISEPWVENPIDAFVLRELREKGLEPNGYADPGRLLRRAALDLTGLPPGIDELDAYLAADPATRYERAVDRLLASPRYGEHQARYWLDAARYGDTHGLHLDNKRSIFPYRTWVIEAFNANKPFDEFAVEQIAGDLLPEPTTAQLVATGFNRCNVTTSEGGAIKEEFRVRYAVDRTETMGSVFMGLTIGCAVCHDHKFDPISQKEFYSLYAYYNSAADSGLDENAFLTPPATKVPSDEQAAEMATLKEAIAKEEKSWASFVASISYPPPSDGAGSRLPPRREEYVWVDDSVPKGGETVATGDDNASGWRWVGPPEHPVHTGKLSSFRESRGRRVAQHYFTGADPLTIGKGDTLFAYVYVDPESPPKAIMLQFNDGDWEQRAIWGGKNAIGFGKVDTPSRFHKGPLPPAGQWVRLEVPVAEVGLEPGDELNGWAFTQAGGSVYWDTAGIVTQNAARLAAAKSLASWQLGIAESLDVLPEKIRAIVKVAEEDRDHSQKEALLEYFQSTVRPQIGKRLEQHAAVLEQTRDKLTQVESQVPSSLIMGDVEDRRETFVLVRGEYDDHGEPVAPGVPAILPDLPADAPPNRLALARWLVREDHPLTARVTVNRIWSHYFGIGLVKTSGDFGTQGEWPSHPDLLDWLAVEFIESGWDVKHIHRLIATSHTYRQSSTMTKQEVALDPENRYFSHGPRFRLDGEVVRDLALSASGLLVEKIGGPSVKPYQPPGIWESVGYTASNTANFVQDHGVDLYRRGVYTFWKRTAPPPMLQTFDAPSREACVVERARTNTPLQALTLMNDVQFVEAARHLAARALTEQADLEDRLTFVFRLLTARKPRTAEIALLRETLAKHLEEYRARPEAAKTLLEQGESPRDESLDAAEHAAWTMIANLLLNLDETVTKN